jgi:NTP pyrophosphatase (non-canonical NTP hydrolase)
MNAEEFEKWLIDHNPVTYKDVPGFPQRRPYEPMEDMEEWMDAIGAKRFSDLPESEWRTYTDRYRRLFYEECFEVDDELERIGNPWIDKLASRPKLAKELADVLVYVYQIAVFMDINLPAVFQLVADNNMTKIDPTTGKPYMVDEGGKVLKPAGFRELTEAEISDVMNFN